MVSWVVNIYFYRITNQMYDTVHASVVNTASVYVRLLCMNICPAFFNFINESTVILFQFSHISSVKWKKKNGALRAERDHDETSAGHEHLVQYDAYFFFLP